MFWAELTHSECWALWSPGRDLLPWGRGVASKHQPLPLAHCAARWRTECNECARSCGDWCAGAGKKKHDKTHTPRGRAHNADRAQTMYDKGRIESPARASSARSRKQAPHRPAALSAWALGAWPLRGHISRSLPLCHNGYDSSGYHGLCASRATPRSPLVPSFGAFGGKFVTRPPWL